MKRFAIVCTIMLAFVTTAEARHRHYSGASHGAHHHSVKSGHARFARYDSGSVVAHPAGCPWHAFCGCGASVKVFGHPVRSLYLAANWFGFPRASAAPGMVAVRSHHVFVIEAVHGDGTVTAYDANSGGHQTRVHRISLAGYTVVNPHGSRVAIRERHARYASHHRKHYASGV